MTILQCYINPQCTNMEQVLTLLDNRFIGRMTLHNMTIEIGEKVGGVCLARKLEGVGLI